MNAGEYHITVKIKVPPGPTCYFESGLACQWILKHSSGQRWCRIFGDTRLEPWGGGNAKNVGKVSKIFLNSANEG